MDQGNDQTLCWVKQYIDKKSLYDSVVRRWSHPLMIPLHCLWAKSNSRMHGQFKFDVTFFFGFDFVCSHARWSYYSIVCWRGWGVGAVRLKLDVQGQGDGKRVRGMRGVLQMSQFSWTSYMYRPLYAFINICCFYQFLIVTCIY